MHSPDRQIMKSLSVLEIMERWPETIGVFLDNAMLCVGCAIAPFHDVHDACLEHKLDEDAFYRQLEEALNRERALKPRAD